MRPKVCITGASRGIGLAEARKLQQQYELFLVASKTSSFKGKEISNCSLFGYDLAKLKGLNDFVEDLDNRISKLDILINNVGVMIMKKLIDMTEQEISYTIDLNLKANILLTHKLLPMLLKAEDPQIIFMSSMAAKSSIIGESVYAATKSAITNFANVLRNELGGKVRISTIHAWGVDTWGAPENAAVLKPENVAEALEFIITRKRPFLIESMDLSHEQQWRGGNAPWSPEA